MVLLGTVAGCGSYEVMSQEDYNNALKSLPANTIAEVLAKGGKTVTPEAHGPTPSGSATTSEETGDGSTPDWSCRNQKVTIQSNPELFTGVVSNSIDTIYPGALLQGKTLSDDPQPIRVARRGGRIYTNVSNGTTDLVQDVSEVSPVNVKNAQDQIVNKLNTYGGAVQNPPSLEVKTFDSLDELAANLSVSTKFLGASVGVDVNRSTSKRKSRVMIMLRQRYYNLIFEPPTADATAFFAPSVTPTQLSEYVQPGNPATYVSQVTYGRLLYVLFESDASKEDLSVAVQASYGVTNASAKVEVKKVSSSTTIKVIPVGGGTPKDSEGLKKLIGGASGDAAFDALGTFVSEQVAAGKTFDKDNPASPIEYVVKDVRTRETVKMNLGLEYTVKECTPVVTTKNAKLWLDANDITKVNEGDRNAITEWPSKIKSTEGKPLNSPNKFCWAYRERTINGLPAVHLDGSANAAVRGMSCEFLSGRTYALASVVDGNNDVNGDAQILATQRGDGDGKWLRFGPSRNSEWFVDHQNVGMRLFSYSSSGGAKLVVTNFDSEGAKTWVNGNESPVSRSSGQAEGSQNTFYSGNTSCSLGIPRHPSSDDCEEIKKANTAGSSPFRGWFGQTTHMSIGEVMGFDHPLSTPERRALECQMAKKWGLNIDKCKDGKPVETY